VVCSVVGCGGGVRGKRCVCVVCVVCVCVVCVKGNGVRGEGSRWWQFCTVWYSVLITAGLHADDMRVCQTRVSDAQANACPRPCRRVARAVACVRVGVRTVYACAVGAVWRGGKCVAGVCAWR